MKIIYATIIASLLLFGTVLVPNYASAVVCQNKTAIVYGNGMFNEKKDADDSLVELEFRVRTYPQASSLLAELEFHLAYADNAGATDPWSLTGVGQVVEVIRQGGNNAYVSMWRWLSGIEAAPQSFQNDMTRIAAAQNAISYVNDVDLQKMLNGDGTVNNPGYRKLLADGKRVLIVSHSQGNFYANAVYNTLNDPLNPRYAKNMGNVQVATPASYVASGGSYTTVPEDAAMAFVIGKLAPSDSVSFQSYNLLPYSLKVSPNFVNLGYAAWATASKGHSFINWYLAWSYTRDRIMGDIIKTINGVNGVGGLQYPTQGCTPPAAGPVATIPQPGPYYFRDDWGVFTFYMSGSNRQSHLKTRSAWARFKNLRDEQKGLAYHIDLDLSQTAPFYWQLPEKASILITDYTSLAKQTIPVTFTGSFKPQDVLLWKGGLIFLSFDHRGYDALTAYHRDNIVRVSWRKLTIVDHGAAAATRWTLKPVQSGVFSMPTYTATQQGWGTMPNGSSVQKWMASNNNQWNKLGVSFRDGMTYTYRIPFSASEAYWTNAPTTPFGWINGVNVAPPNPTAKNYLGDYGVLEVIDGLLSFTPLGQVPLHSTGTKQSGMVPQINTFGGIEQTRAYQDTQGIVNKAALVEEASQPNWRIVGKPPAVGAPPLGMLKSTLPANGLFFNPRTWTRYYGTTPRIPTAIFQVFTYSQIYVPYSLSNQMAGARAEVVYASKINVSQGASFYKLGQTFAVPYNTYPFPIPAVTRGDKSFYCAVGVTPCFPGGIYGISVSAAQQAAMISPVP